MAVDKSDRKRLVLGIDDDPNIHMFLRAIVRDQNLRYLSAGTGQKAMAMAKRHLPDLVFMDIMLPDTDGFQLCQALRDEIEDFVAPVIFLSGNQTMTDVKMAVAMGGADYLVKPFKPDSIVARLNKWLGEAE